MIPTAVATPASGPIEVAAEVPRNHYLTRNGHTNDRGEPGYIVSASALIAWSRCQLARYYELRARHEPDAAQPAALSAASYGSVVHHAVHAMERAHHEGHTDALAVGLATFDHYWDPEHWGELGLAVTEWLPRQTYGGLAERGRRAIRDYYELQRRSDARLLALEYPFAVPLAVGGRIHTLHGFVDRLEVARVQRKPVLRLVDYKTGKQPTYLRHHAQGSFYALASTSPAFWTGWADSGLEELEHFDAETIGRLEQMFSSWGYRLHSDSPAIGDGGPLASRKFVWVNLHEIRFADGGWRNARDYARLGIAVDAYVRASEAGVYAVNQVGEVCRTCSFREVCGGVGLPAETEGAP